MEKTSKVTYSASPGFIKKMIANNNGKMFSVTLQDGARKTCNVSKESLIHGNSIVLNVISKEGSSSLPMGAVHSVKIKGTEYKVMH